MTWITELQARLSPTQMRACTPPVAPQSLDNNQGTDPTDITTKWDLFLDLVAAALMCDRTRIVTIGVHKALGPGPDPNDPTLVGHYHSEDASGGTWHGLAHDWGNANSRRMLHGINAWITDNIFLKLIEKLDVAESGGSTVLDNSLLYWGNELGFNHIGYSVPCMLAGSAGGYIQPGRYLDYIDWACSDASDDATGGGGGGVAGAVAGGGSGGVIVAGMGAVGAPAGSPGGAGGTGGAALGSAHWGRIHFKVQLPVPDAFVHSTLVALSGVGPTRGASEYRVVDTVKQAIDTPNVGSRIQFLWNVQPQSSGEFGEGAGNYDGADIPDSFDELKVGWNNYQQAPPGFTAWIDDVALDDERVGCLP